MDVVDSPPTDSPDVDPKQWLKDDVERVRAERDDLDRQIAADRERLASIRSALDNMVNASWRDVYGQQQHMREQDSITNALTLGWTGAYQLFAIGGFVVVAGGMVYGLQGIGVVLAIGLYLLLALIGYFVARDQCLAPIRKARSSYLGSDGKDVRFVAFTRYETGLNHPLLGYDGPIDGVLEDRAWKIPGVREKDAMEETFVEVIDERRSNVLLTRFPDKKPTLVHADLENPFIRSYGVFFQRALERHLPQVKTQADEFREIVAHSGARKDVDERLRRMEEELREYDGTAAIVKALALPATVRNALLRQIILFRLGDPAVRRGLFIRGDDRVDMTDVMQTCYIFRFHKSRSATLAKAPRRSRASLRPPSARARSSSSMKPNASLPRPVRPHTKRCARKSYKRCGPSGNNSRTVSMCGSSPAQIRPKASTKA
jgi:hypothetical protein